ncbi:Tetraacyldisaccharide 4'-kinase [Dirofilaria immitis]
MYSTSELGDSRKELRQVECCVHGRPCTIASKLSQRNKKTDRGSSLSSYDLIDSGRKMVSEKSEPHMHNDFSYNLDRKVEREALDVPIRKWNFRKRSSNSSLRSEPIANLAEIEDSKPLRIPTKHIRDKNECQPTARTLNKSFVGRMKQGIFSKEKYNEYEMMHPMDPSIAQAPMSAEETLWTAIHGSMEVSPSMEAYIGIMTANQAENYVIKPASFKLYHMMPKIDSLNNILPSLGLYIIYRSSKGHA